MGVIMVKSDQTNSNQEVVDGGSSAYKGFGIGKIHVFGGKDEVLNSTAVEPKDKDAHLRKLLKAVHKRFQKTHAILADKGDDLHIKQQRQLVEVGITAMEGEDQFVDFLKTSAPDYDKQSLQKSFRQSYDLFQTAMGEAGGDIILHLMSENSGVPYENVDEVMPGSVLVAGEVGMLASIELIEKDMLAGVVSSKSDAFHLLVLCKGSGIPSIAESDLPEEMMKNPSEYQGQKIIVDSSQEQGRIILNPEKDVLAEYKKAQKVEKLRKEEQKKHAFESCVTKDGTHVSIWSNNNDLEFDKVKELPIDGIGLLRLESLFAHHASKHELLDSGMLSSQFDEACQHLSNDRPVTVRLLDINGHDKKADELLVGFQKDMAVTHDDEGNELLGTAFLLKNQGLFEMQVKSVINAHAHHPQRILMPYVNSADEVKQVRKIVNDVFDEMKADNHLLSAPPPIFSMIETEHLTRNPKELEKVIKLSDGISIGGNDLSCELAGVERYGDSSKKGGVLPIYNPEFVQKLSDISELSMKHGKEVSMCGDCASDLDFVPVLVAMGIKPVVLGAMTYDIRDRIQEMNIPQTKEMVEGIKELKTSKGVYNRITKFADEHFSAPLSSVHLSLDAE